MKKLFLLSTAAIVAFAMVPFVNAQSGNDNSGAVGNETSTQAEGVAVVPPEAPPETVVVKQKPVAIDAITGEAASASTAPKEKEKSLRDQVREKME